MDLTEILDIVDRPTYEETYMYERPRTSLLAISPQLFHFKLKTLLF